MKMNALVHASINQLSLVDLRIDPCKVSAWHHYEMAPAPIERFVYIVKGKARFFLEHQEFEAEGSDMIFLPGKTAYRSEWQEDSEFMVVDLLLRDIEGQVICFDEAPGVLFHDTHRAYRGLLEELSAIAAGDGPFDWLERLSLSFKFLCEVARDTNRNESDERFLKIKPALSYLEHGFARDFSVEELAKLCCLSVGSFRRLFSEYTGLSPVEYRNRLRIRKATALLKTKKYTVGEVAEAVGVDDIKYFSKLFKRYTGFSPGVMKKP